ncbi:MAG: RNA-binding protein [Anaerolineaceae bacterium 4572_78]|nr:MAG: RNA-binding protein [Anaerolineaceae bacterium 4572_78]
MTGKELIEYIAKSIVNNPDAVVVDELSSRYNTIYELMVDPDDMGRVIGKRGRMAKAIRSLLRVSGIKTDKRISLEIIET